MQVYIMLLFLVVFSINNQLIIMGNSCKNLNGYRYFVYIKFRALRYGFFLT